jgi:hypothetical protein
MQGPNVALAREMLTNGERGVVLEYLSVCKDLWPVGNGLDAWINEVGQGKIPDFGSALIF